MAKTMSTAATALLVGACILLCGLVHAVPADLPVRAALDGFVRSLPFSRRHMLQEEDVSGDADALQGLPECVWSANKETCLVNPLLALGLVEKAPESELKDIIFSTVECHFKQEKEGCVASEKCKWDTQHNLCEYIVDITELGHFRRCLGGAAVFLEAERKGVACAETYVTEDSCNISEECSWEPSDESCVFDILKVLTGVASMDTLPKGLSEILTFRGEELGASAAEVDLQTPQDFLDWEFPPFTCPDGVDQVICHVAEEGDATIKTELFCALQHAADGICNEDERCFFDDTVEDEALRCRLSDQQIARGKTVQRETYINTIPSPAAIAILKQQFHCKDMTKATCAEPCLWDDGSKSCYTEGQFVIQEIARHPLEKGSDTTCQLVKEMFSSGCLELDSEACIADGSSRCIWDESDGLCSPGPFALTEILFRGDDELQTRAETLYQKCHGIQSESTCR